jgi:FixJ family two-component response regulator
MPGLHCQTDTIRMPRQYKNRPAPRGIANPSGESLRDILCLVDNDTLQQDEISSILNNLNPNLIMFSRAADYLDYARRDIAACVIINTRLPDMCGLELQRQHNERSNAPVIMISGQCDIPSAVQAMKAGAIDFLTKPLEPFALMASVQSAILQDRKRRNRKAELAKLEERLSLLTPREREVLPLVVGGLLNKQAASILGISEVTLQIHRSQAMRKMQADSVADLVRMAIKLRIPHWQAKGPGQDNGQGGSMFLVPTKCGNLI